MKTETTFNQLFKIVDKHLINYKGDLTEHDLNGIKKRPGCKFLHITRRNGTCIIFLDPIDLKKHNPGTTTEQAIKGKNVFIEYYLNTPKPEVICFFDGDKVKKINAEKAFNLFSQYSAEEIRKADLKEQQEKNQYLKTA